MDSESNVEYAISSKYGLKRYFESSPKINNK